MVSHGYEDGTHPQARRWYKCHDCGWEHEYVAMAAVCGNCGGHLNIHSDLDGEKPETS